MSDGARARDDAVAFLATVPLLDGMPGGRAGGARPASLRRRELPAGEVLWREGDEADGDAR